MKVLTEEGLKILWNQINLKDYPNNEMLIAVLNAVDETKADKTYVDAKFAEFIAVSESEVLALFE